MLTTLPGIQAALTCTLATPFTVSEGTRKLTWYASAAPGYPTAPTTSADFPLTNTSTGEFTACVGFAGNGLPGSTPGCVGPRPFIKIDRISPAAAGLDA